MFEKQKYSYSVDVWSLGIILFEMYHGKSPFNEDNPFKVYKNIIQN